MTLNIDTAHRDALRMDAILEDMEWQTTAWLTELLHVIDIWTGPDTSGWNQVSKDRATEILTQRSS